MKHPTETLARGGHILRDRDGRQDIVWRSGWEFAGPLPTPRGRQRVTRRIDLGSRTCPRLATRRKCDLFGEKLIMFL